MTPINKISLPGNIKETLRIYALSLAIPLGCTVVFVLGFILGLETVYSFWDTIEILWVGFYFTGEFMGIDSWRWHLGAMFLIWFFLLFDMVFENRQGK